MVSVFRKRKLKKIHSKHIPRFRRNRVVKNRDKGMKITFVTGAGVTEVDV